MNLHVRNIPKLAAAFAFAMASFTHVMPSAADDVVAVVDFSRDIRPILSDKCFFCHGPDASHRKAKLRLDQKEHALGERDGIWPFKAGSLKDSEAWFLINHEDPDERMPPAKSNKSLSAREKELIKKWIEQGAKWQGHWSFETPSKPALPVAKNKQWAKNPIDAFILARLEAAGLSPSPEASREVLVRRVSFDLTGQPPTLEEIDAYVSDKSADAYEKMVDRFFVKKAFGERMALAWMDAGRYGDSSVFHADGPRTMWPWRNWVIDAYNSNMPFDQFTIEQLAGDLIPDASVSQKIASGFHRNHGTTDEGGAIAEEYRVEYVVDRLKTTGSVWLGMSVECAQCHDHKYDPITQKEYFGLYAFFNQTTDPGMQSRKGNQTPVVNVPDPAKEAERVALEKQAVELDGKLQAHAKTVEPAFVKWVEQAAVNAKAGDKPETPEDMFAHLTFDQKTGNKVIDGIDRKRIGTVKGKATWAAGKHGGAFKLDRKNFIDFGNLADFERTQGFSYGCWINPDDVGNGVPIGKMNEGNAHRGYDLYISRGTVSVHIINSWPGNAIKVTTKAKVAAKKWTHVFATYDGSSKAAGVKIYFDGKEQPWAIEQNGLSGTIKTKVPLKIGGRNNSGQFAGLVDDARFYNRALSGTEVAALAGSDTISPILAINADKRTKQQQETLRTHYLHTIDKTYSKLNAEKSKVAAQIAGLSKSNITSMIMGEQPKPRMTYLLMRGHYASPDKSEVIKPDVPKVFPPLAEGLPHNRLGLAKWLTDKKHPLTARVAVNRYWSMLFGTGIVATVMDFGSQGRWPSHPELLDWLATDLSSHGWDIKRTLKQIVMSATYRQSSRNTSILAQRDPENILLGRGSRFRLQGEFIRDNALLLSGLMVDKVGGPSVKPYQPPGLWNEVALTGNVRFVQDHGENLYRKSMYIYWKRSAPHPGMMILDAPTRELCVVQRPRTNTPLAALYTMNDTQFVEASRFLAQRMMLEGGKAPAERAAFAYRLATSRKPSAAALKTLVSLYETELATFKKDEAKAKELLSVGEAKRDETLNMVEHAAWTNVAGVILNMDATLTRY